MSIYVAVIVVVHTPSELQAGHKTDAYTTGKMSKSEWQTSLKVLILITDLDIIYAGWLLLIVLLHVSNLPYNLHFNFKPTIFDNDKDHPGAIWNMTSMKKPNGPGGGGARL